jgi:hypothetical protein
MKTNLQVEIEAITNFANALKLMKNSGVIRSGRYTGDIGEWLVEQLYQGKRSTKMTEKGWDVMIDNSGDQLQVKTQTYDPKNTWNYFDSPQNDFTRFVQIILTDDILIQDIFDVPRLDFLKILRKGKDNKLSYKWNELKKWRVVPNSLPGYHRLSELFKK